MKKRIVCFGDSNTFGFNAKTQGRFDEDIRWTQRLGKALGQDYTVIEEGLPGRNAVCEDPLKEGLAGIAYLYPCLCSHAPIDLVIIMLGTNDAKERFSLTSYNMAMGIMRLSEKVRNSMAGPEGRDPFILIVAPPPIGEGYKEKSAYLSMGKNCQIKTKEMVPYLEEMAKEKEYFFLDAGQSIAMADEDFVHLDEQGHEKMAIIMEQKILEIFQKS